MSESTRKEVLAGLSTFFTLSYLFLLYPQILSEGGVDFGSALSATALISIAATLLLALIGKFPAVLAPGLSVGPYLVYSIILKQGASWQTALGIVFWAGAAIFLLTVFRIRQQILLHLPAAIKTSATCGIGLFLICVGLKNLGILIPKPFLFSIGPLFTPENGIALFGLLLLFFLYRINVSGCFLLAILVCWIAGLLTGLASWKGFAALPPSLSPTLFKLDLLSPLSTDWLGAILTILLICLFDTTAALTVLARLSRKTNEQGRIEHLNRILLSDSLGNMAASLLGTGTLTFTLESSSGIKAGGRSGLTAATAAFCILICLFLFPLISSIPLFATAPALIAIGVFMALEAKGIAWKDPTEALPALLTLLAIPLTFNIYLGFVLGFISYPILKALFGKAKEVHPICWALALIFALHLGWSYSKGII